MSEIEKSPESYEKTMLDVEVYEKFKEMYQEMELDDYEKMFYREIYKRLKFLAHMEKCI